MVTRMAITAMATLRCRSHLAGVGVVAGVEAGAVDGMAEEVGTVAAAGMVADIVDAPTGPSRLDFC